MVGCPFHDSLVGQGSHEISKLTIVQDIIHLGDYPFEAIRSSALATLRLCAKDLPEHIHCRIGSVLTLLECHLQLTAQDLKTVSLKKQSMHAIFKDLVGAMYSTRFCNFTVKTRDDYARRIIALYKVMCARAETEPDKLLIAAVGRVEIQQRLVTLESRLDYVEKMIWKWTGWPIVNLKGERRFVPLLAVSNKYGRKFVTKFHNAINIYFSNRRANGIPCVMALAAFLGSEHCKYSTEDFQNGMETFYFLEDFMVFYAVHSIENGASVEHIATQWNVYFRAMFSDHFTHDGLFASPAGVVPYFPVRGLLKSSDETHKGQGSDDEDTNYKGITPVPLEMTDNQAVEKIMTEIVTDLEMTLSWCRKKIKNLTDVIAARDKISEEYGGQDRPPSENSFDKITRYRINTCVNLRSHGYRIKGDGITKFNTGFPKTLVSEWLGLPNTDTLTPHCLLLAHLHPEITAAFLEYVQLTDQKGSPLGYYHLEGKYFLVSYKPRKGIKTEQTVELTPESNDVVKAILECTAPVRQFLHKTCNPLARELLISVGQAFGTPRRFEPTVATCGKARVSYLKRSFSKSGVINESRAGQIAANISCPSIRAATATVIFIQSNGDVALAAKRLGHNSYDPDLLSRYIPKPVIRFFRDRWVQAFQTGMILEGLKDSKHLLRASGFRSFNEIDEFLKSHGLGLIPKQPAALEKTKREKLVIGINETVLSLLLSIEQAISNTERLGEVTDSALEWASYCSKLTNHIESEHNVRDDFKDMLVNARTKIDVSLVEHLVYA